MPGIRYWTVSAIRLMASPGRPLSRYWKSVRGEIIMRLSAFEELLNERLLAAGQEPFANPRNAAAGSLRQLDPTVTAQRPLDIYVYDVLAVRGTDFGTHREALGAIRSWGFPVSDPVRDGRTVDDTLAYHAELRAQRDELDFEIDGVVIKLDDLAAPVTGDMLS